MKDNLFPLSVKDIEVFFWTGNGDRECECSILRIDENTMEVYSDGVVPRLGTRGIFWRPFEPILPAVVTDSTAGGFIAEFTELRDEPRKFLKAIVASRAGEPVRNGRRPSFVARTLLRALFNLEQSLPDIHRRTFPAAEFPWSLEFEREWKAIRNEVENIFRNVDVGDIPLGVDQLANWHSVLIAEKGRPTAEAKKLLPNTSRLVSAVPSLLNADLSILRPGAVIDYHKANSRSFLRMHLGLIVPRGDVCLQLEDQKLHWSAGSVLIFDDFYPHAAWNRTAETRVILMVDFLRPMPKWASALIRCMHRMTAKPLPNIPRHWLNWRVKEAERSA